MSNHTKAPWSIQWGAIQDGDGHRIIDGTGDAGPDGVANVLFHEDFVGETKANAHLIAAAPDLLAALISLANEINLRKLSVRKDFSLLNAHAYATKIIEKATANA